MCECVSKKRIFRCSVKYFRRVLIFESISTCHGLGGKGVELEALDDGGQEEGEGVERGGVEDVGDHVHVDLPVNKDGAELSPREGGLGSWASVDEQSADSQVLLLGAQEGGGRGEIGQVEEDDNGQEDSGQTLQNENPLPAYYFICLLFVCVKGKRQMD